jgi:hypothetical protein
MRSTAAVSIRVPLLALAVIATACTGPRLGPAAEGHTLIERWPNPRPAWVDREAHAPPRLEADDSLVFVGRAHEVAFQTGKLAALADADQGLARTISARLLNCGSQRGTSRDDAAWDFYTRRVVSAFMTGVLPPLEYYERWRRQDGSTYYRWQVRSTIRTRQLRESIDRSVELLDPEVSDDVRQAIRSCLAEGMLP